MFKKKTKTLTKEVGVFNIEVSDSVVTITSKSKNWSMSFANTTVPYYRISDAVMTDNENTESFCQVLYVLSMQMATDDKLTEQLLKTSEKYWSKQAKNKKTTAKEDEIALRETQVLLQQDEEAVQKHIDATKK